MTVMKGVNNDYKVIKPKNSEGARLVVQLTGKEQGALLQCLDGNIENALDNISIKQQNYSIVAFHSLDTTESDSKSKVQLDHSEYWLSPQISDWEILGKGSFGTVYSANSVDNKLVALKVFECKQEWQQELDNTQKLKALNPPKGICLPIDYGLFNGMGIIVYSRGSGNCHLTSRLPVNLLLEGLSSLAFALSWLHKQGLFHGDIKLDNLLLSNDGLSFIDFGLLADKVSPTSDIPYICYRSPEMAIGKICFKTEVLALGGCFYQMFVCNLLHTNGLKIKENSKKLTPRYQVDFKPPQNWLSPYLLNYDELDNLLAGIFSRSYLPNEQSTLISIFQLIKDMLVLDNSVRPTAQEVYQRVVKLQGVCFEK